MDATTQAGPQFPGAYASNGSVQWFDPKSGQTATAPNGTPIPADAKTPPVSAAFQPPARPAPGSPMAPYRAAIANNESGGNYAQLGPIVNEAGDRALGKYGIMGSNLPQWSQAALGRAVTPQEFLASREIQDQVFDHVFGGLLKQNAPQDAASIWLTGRTLANGGAAAKDMLGTSGQAYAQKFMAGLGPKGEPTSAPALGAPGAPTPTTGAPDLAQAAQPQAPAAPQSVNWAQLLAGLAPPPAQAPPVDQPAPMALARLAPAGLGENLTQATAGNLLLQG